MFSVALALVACSDDEESPVIDLGTGASGTCLELADDVGPEITDLPEVDCAVQHTHEIIGIVTSAEKVYPGFEALETEAQAACLKEFEPYVGINPFDSELFVTWMVPTLNSWDGSDDREIVCLVGNGNGAPLVGTVKGAQR